MTLDIPLLSNDLTKQILDPLSKATSTLLEPTSLFVNEYMEVDIDEDGKRFIINVKAMKPFQGVLPFGMTEKHIVRIGGKDFIEEAGGASHRNSEVYFRRFPEAKQQAYGRWRVAVTDISAIILNQSWPQDRLYFKSETALVTYRYLLARFFNQTRNAVRAAQFKLHGVLPEIPKDFPIHPKFPPLKHQWVPIVNSLFQEAYGLFMDTGTCKTSTVINRVCYEAMHKHFGTTPGAIQLPKTLFRALILCPNAVRFNWDNEFQQFATVPGKTAIMRGDEVTRTRRMVEGISQEADCWFGAVICGFDSVGCTMDALIRVGWDLIIWDEVHNCKNSRTDRWQSSVQLCKEGHVRERMILTGSPIANSIMDLWAEFELLGEGLSGFQSFKHFRQFFGKFTKTGETETGSAIEKLVGIKNVPLIQERLARLTFMITKEQAGLSLPDKTYDVIEIEMTPKQATLYRQVKSQMAIEIEALSETEMGKRMTADHVLTKLLRLAHITSGFVTWDEQIDVEGNIISPKRVEKIEGDNPKIDALVESIRADMVSDPLGKKLIWACWQQDIHAIAERLTAEGIKFVTYYGGVADSQRAGVVDAFNNDPTITAFLGNQDVGGTGLNLLGYDPKEPERLPTYTDHEYFFSQNWRAVLRQQAEDRAHRKGTRANLRITDFVVPGTVDEEIRVRVLQKLKDALMIQDIREILRNVLGFYKE